MTSIPATFGPTTTDLVGRRIRVSYHNGTPSDWEGTIHALAPYFFEGERVKWCILALDALGRIRSIAPLHVTDSQQIEVLP